MALTKVTGQVIKNTTDVTVGVLTVTNTLAVGGTVSIGGTLTYEDVTNIDSVGLITARNGIVVGSGITLSKDGEIFATGISTFSDDVNFNADLNITGSSNKLRITSAIGNLGILSSTTNDITFDFFDDDTQTRLRTVDGRFQISADHRNEVADSQIRFIVDGTNQASIDGNGHFYFRNDSDTYFNRPDTNTLAFTTADSERLRIESGGNVGIGTSNANNLLHVYGGQIKAQTSTDDTNTDVDLIRAQCGSGGNALFSIRAADAADDNSDWNIKTNANEELSFTIGAGTEKARITSSGNVGIGTSVPASKLDVYDTSGLGIISRSAATQATDTNKALKVRNNSTTDTFSVSYKGQGYFAGRVGIDSTTPVAKLDVVARGDTEKGIRLTDPNNAQSAPYIEVIGNRGDGNSSQGFSGKLHLARHRSDEKVTVNNMLGAVAFGGNHTDGDPSNILYTASISAIASDDFDSSTDMPTDLIFLTGSTGRTPTAVNITTGSEKVRITAGGRTYVNTTSPIDGNSMVAIVGQFGTGGCGVEIKHDGNPASNRDFIRFFNSANSEAGSIEHNASTSVSFKTSSDHRLKENIADITDGIERLKLLKPRKFSWIDDPELGLRDGFIAHEVSPVIPHCVSGEKDAVKEDGSIHTQTMEYSQLTPLLTAALQESIAKIEVLEAEVAALKSS